MKKNIALLLPALFLMSCIENRKEQDDHHSYYVKYEVEAPVLASQTGSNSITVKNKQIDQTVSINDPHWHQTIGPLKKGYVTQITTHTTVCDSVHYTHAKIFIARDEEDFVLKAENTGLNDVEVSYTIE